MLTIAKETNILFNEEYIQHQTEIINIQKRLEQDIQILGFDSNDYKDALDYVQDKVTIFRFLKDTDFDLDKAMERLLDTIEWRRENGIGRMTYQSIASEFFEGGFAFFHKHDLIGRPVAIIQMRHFPKFKDKTKSLTEFMKPFACLVMEMARQITRDLTRNNEIENNQPILVSQISIIIDIAKAPFVPVDSSLIQTLQAINNSRFPGFVGSVYIMNFGWMYQGIWQVVKLVLTEQAKARVNFITAQETKHIMDENNLLKALGGKDTYEWSLDSDLMLDLYATENRFISTESLVPSCRTSRSSSLSSIFFDAQSHFDPTSSYNTPGSSTPMHLYQTPGSLTPIHSYTQRQVVVRSEPRYFLNGFHMGDTFLTSFFRQTINTTNSAIDSNDLTSRLNQLITPEDTMLHFPHMLPDDHPQSMYLASPLKMQLVRVEQRLTRYTRKLFHLSFACKGAVYWLLLYCLLRGPVEHTFKKTLAKLFTSQQQIAYSTIGATATIAAVVSASIQNNILNKP
ncbi:hypothetical protein HPULCUR_005054 [Helicostylum pulchrum]|uniref:CRAL-TRIO domain-containing protein n=1 Tax=Helicostylum pulchrum TaxID=562976 RepID=A0ABP9XYX2_9FUNG